ncbi:MAG: hypothetical protein KBG25_00305 [Paludibacteraceae bacterium]|nr:hypothetical protein [Paludibacteraceae bacterium]
MKQNEITETIKKLNTFYGKTVKGFWSKAPNTKFWIKTKLQILLDEEFVIVVGEIE